jgi:1-acyl-sn-glycerol-3-phosphate acyltransferase
MLWLRSAAFNAFFVIATLAILVPGTLVRLLAPRHALAVARAWGRTALWGARVICGVRWRVEGWENLPREPALIASRHESAFDTFVWLLLLPRAAYVVKQELVRIPLLGPLMPLAGMIPVDRGAGAAGLRRLAEGAAAALGAGRPVVIFPEGTRVEPDTPVALQPGIALLAARTGAPVVPVATDSGRFWGRRAFLKRPGVIRIVLRPAIPAATPRAALMAELAAGLRLAPVDNSVGEVVSTAQSYQNFTR